MTTLIMSDVSGTLGFPTREEIRAMLRHPGVMIAAIAGATLVLLSAIAGIVILAYAGKGTEAVGALLLGVLGLVLAQLQKIKHQTNGTTTRLLDAALPPTPPQDAP